jgi:hypothetical protein
MKWVTRRSIRVNRAATAWLVRRFIDPDATFAFVAAEDVAEFQAREGAIGFDAPGATYGLRAISRGLALVAGDDLTMLERASLLYDGLYAHLAEGERPPP